MTFIARDVMEVSMDAIDVEIGPGGYLNLAAGGVVGTRGCCQATRDVEVVVRKSGRRLVSEELQTDNGSFFFECAIGVDTSSY